MKVHVVTHGCKPYKKHATDAGWDLRSTEYKKLYYNEEHMFNTGIRVEMPVGYCGLVVPRSGLGNLGATLKNTVGVIDSDYRGNIYVKIRNNSEKPLEIKQFDRFAQLIIVPIYLGEIEYVDSVSDTDRGSGGFGSTGV